MFVSPMIVINFFQFWLVLFLVGLMNSFVWVWSINEKLQSFSQTISNKLFKVAFWIPFIYIWTFIAFMLFNLFVRKVKSINIEVEIMIFTAVGVISICCIFYGLIYIGRLIRSVELGKKPSMKDHLIESVLMLFPPIGLWIIQPKLNRIIANQQQ
jgi:hypothetical protein